MKKVYLVLILSLLMTVAAFAQPLSRVSLPRHYATENLAPTTCSESVQSQALIYIRGIGLRFCKSGVYEPITSVAGVSSVNGQTGVITLSASSILSGIFSTDRLGSGTPSISTYLRGDGTWAAVSGGTGLPAKIVVANEQSGADLGAKINAADTVCGNNVSCTIWVFDGGSSGANTWTTQPVISKYHTLRFGEGTFYVGNYSQIGSILIKDNVSVIGSGYWNTIIVEYDDQQVQSYNPTTDVSTAGIAGYRVIAPYGNQFSCVTTGLTAGSNNTCRASNLHISGIQFKGVRSNVHDGGVAGTLNMGHCWNCSVTYNWFNEVGGYAAHYGSTQSEAQGDVETVFTHGGETYYSANFAKNVWFTDNLITNSQSQGFAIITAENAHIERNTFRDAGKVPFTIQSVTNPSGAPIVVTTTENHNFYSNVGVKLKGVTNVGGSPAINPNTTYYVRPVSRNSFSIRATVGGARINGTGTGTYTVTSASKTDLQGIFVALFDLEPNGSIYERANNINLIDNIFDVTAANGVFVTGIVWQTTAALPTRGGRISGNTITSSEEGTGLLSVGLQLLNPFNKDVIISNNYIQKAVNIGIQLQGDRLQVFNNRIIDGGGGGSGSIQTTITNSTIYGNVAQKNVAATSWIREMGTNTGNLWYNNKFDRHTHDSGSTVTNSRYFYNFLAEATQDTGFSESTNSNNNLFDGNLTRPKDAANSNLGLTIVGAGSKVLSHKYTDGRTFITNINGVSVPFTNPN